MNDLKSYATARQIEYIEAIEEHGSQAKAAKALGINSRTLERAMSSLKRRAALQGWSPEHDMTHTVPEGFNVRGVSTYYDEDGKPRGQWVKSQQDREAREAILVERLETAHENWKPYKRIQKPKGTDSDLLTQVVITDFHLGMLAWEKETGEAWDTNLARDVFLSAVLDMIEVSPKCGTGILVQLGDFLHFDGLDSVTPTSHHVLDSDSRYGRVVDLTMAVMPEAAGLMLEHFDKVIVVQAEGNHDKAGSVWLRKFMKHLFKSEPRLEVIDNEFPYYAYLHGQTLLGYHHGHLSKKADLPKVFSSDPRFRPLWGQATRCYIHVGHYHHERKVEEAGAVVEQHPTLAARDSYATRLGLVSNRGAKVHVYHKTEGEMNVHTVRPRF